MATLGFISICWRWLLVGLCYSIQVFAITTMHLIELESGNELTGSCKGTLFLSTTMVQLLQFTNELSEFTRLDLHQKFVYINDIIYICGYTIYTRMY